MKHPNVLVLPILFLSLTALPALAETADTEKSPKTPPPMSQADKKKLKDLRERIEKAKAGLNGSSWQVSYQSSDPKIKALKDTFLFQDSMFKSKELIGRGYRPTNYTVSMAGESTELAIFETMLTSKDGVAFVRGEWLKDQMSGRVSEQLEGGKKVLDYTFTTSGRKAVPASSEEKKEGTQAEAAADAGQAAGSSLVSKEGQPGPDVTPFVPGTTEESD